MYWAQSDNLPTSGIREILDIALQMPDVIRLETGEPNFPPDRAVIDAFHQAARSGHNRYTSSWGHPQLREALIDKIQRINHVQRAANEIVVTPGGSPGLLLAFLGILQPGDELLVPNPGWPDYLGGVYALHIQPISYPMPAPEFWPDLGQLQTLVTSKTRAIVVNFPGNPAGSIPPVKVIEELVAFARKHDLWIISDEVYDQIVFTDQVLSPAQIAPERTISVYSFSKTYAMTGWRLGYVTAPWPYSESLYRVAMGLWSSVSEPLQYAGLAALNTGGEGIQARLEHYRRRRQLAWELLQSYDIPCHLPDGAFYVLVDISSMQMHSRDFALKLLEHEHVAVAPGSTFGTETRNFVRISLASSEEDLSRGLTALAQVLATGYKFSTTTLG